jgi:hypothetical protein
MAYEAEKKEKETQMKFKHLESELFQIKDWLRDLDKQARKEKKQQDKRKS